MSLGIRAVALASLLSSSAMATEWSRFRGPNGTGVDPSAKSLPLSFGPGENVVWKTELPPGHSSPILTRDRVFLTAFENDALITFGLDRETGAVLWRREAPRARVTKVDDRNNAASPSPAVDERAVYVFFPDFGLLAYDFDGNELWKYPLEPFENVYGMGASPVVAGDKVVLVCDQNLHSYILALHRDTGKVAWKMERPEATSGHSTPVLSRDAEGELEILVPGSFQLTSYSVATGQKRWWVTGLSFEMKSTPVLADGILYINGYGAPENQPGTNVKALSWTEALTAQDGNKDGQLEGEELQGHARSWFGFTDLNGDGRLDDAEWRYYEAALASRNGILAIRIGGEGDMTEKNVAWAYHKRVPQLPSPLLYQGVLYMVNDGGVVTTLDPGTGEMGAQGRLKGAVDNYYASPVAADGKIFFASELGKIAVISPGGGLEVLAVNDLGDLIYATPAIDDGRIFVRTRGALYCFGVSSSSPFSSRRSSCSTKRRISARPPGGAISRRRALSWTPECRWTRRTAMERRLSSSPRTRGTSLSSSFSSSAEHRPRFRTRSME
jgi:outer membrane protein assembly factor BamB